MDGWLLYMFVLLVLVFLLWSIDAAGAGRR